MPINTNVPTRVLEDAKRRREQFIETESRVQAPNPGIFLPPRVAKELLAERQRNVTDVLLSTYRDHICETWDRELKRMDPLLCMRRAHEKPALSAISRGLHPGLYHIIRQNENAPLSLFAIQDPATGGFIEPSEDVLERLRKMDSHNGRAEKLRLELQREARRHEQRAKELAHEERVALVNDHWAALSRTQVSMNPDAPWTQNASAASRRDAASRRGKPKP